jgi:cellulose synthase/poly-beta-1,6-N-acetylglucosamine synthase-like glycosyltransferase
VENWSNVDELTLGRSITDRKPYEQSGEKMSMFHQKIGRSHEALRHHRQLQRTGLLEQCLRTVFEAMKGIDGDVFVVDNLSTDGSVEMVREKFPQVKLIANRRTSASAVRTTRPSARAMAEYVVLLNPDTVVGEDVFHKVIAFMDAHPKAGGLG